MSPTSMDFETSSTKTTSSVVARCSVISTPHRGPAKATPIKAIAVVTARSLLRRRVVE